MFAQITWQIDDDFCLSLFISRKLNKDLTVQEVKPATVFQCKLCDAGYIGYTRGHLHEHVDGHIKNRRQFANIIWAKYSPTYMISASV